MTQILAAAAGLSVLIPFVLYEPKDPKPATYTGRRRMAEPPLLARLKLRTHRRIAWFVLAQTLRYRLTVQIGALA